jgi:hypothetical protein
MDEYELPPQKGMDNFRHRTMEDQVKDASESIRRWWWEYLRLSKDYWLLCMTCPEGKPETYDETLAQIFRDFGNVHEGTFEDWWRRTGSALFAEQQLPPKVQQITSVESAIAGDRAGKILVEIPLQLTRETVQKQLTEILDLNAEERNRLIEHFWSDRRESQDQASSNQRQRALSRLDTSTSRYRIEPVLTRLTVVGQAHEVYCLHRELIEKPKALARLGKGKALSEHNEDGNLFRIGKLYGLSPQNSELVGTPEVVARKSRNMRSEVSRVLARAKSLLSYVEVGRFAVIKEDPLAVPPRFSSKQEAHHAKLEEQWWELDLTSSLSKKKTVEDARRIHYAGD